MFWYECSPRAAHASGRNTFDVPGKETSGSGWGSQVFISTFYGQDGTFVQVLPKSEEPLAELFRSCSASRGRLKKKAALLKLANSS